jgi:hypothetical protein
MSSQRSVTTPKNLGTNWVPAMVHRLDRLRITPGDSWCRLAPRNAGRQR